MRLSWVEAEVPVPEPEEVVQGSVEASECDKLRAELAQMRDDAMMACECPPTNCECAGCSYARERAREERHDTTRDLVERILRRT